MTRWVVFGVLIAIIPFGFSWYMYWNATGRLNNYYAVFGHGDLNLVSVAIAAQALGEMISAKPKLEIERLCVGGVCLLLLACGCLLYGSAAQTIASGQMLHDQRTASVSVTIYAFTMFFGALGMWLTEE